MASYNKIILAGNLVRDPEIKQISQSNTTVMRSAIAVNRKYKDKEEVTFIDIIAFGKLAEIFEQYASKGSQVLVEGRLTQNTWEKDGQKHSKHEVVVEVMQLLGSKGRMTDSKDGNIDPSKAENPYYTGEKEPKKGAFCADCGAQLDSIGVCPNCEDIPF